jgi:hypothetical protein
MSSADMVGYCARCHLNMLTCACDCHDPDCCPDKEDFPPLVCCLCTECDNLRLYEGAWYCYLHLYAVLANDPIRDPKVWRICCAVLGKEPSC